MLYVICIMIRKKQNFETKECHEHGATASVYLIKVQVKFINQGELFSGYVKHSDSETLFGESLEELQGTFSHPLEYIRYYMIARDSEALARVTAITGKRFLCSISVLTNNVLIISDLQAKTEVDPVNEENTGEFVEDAQAMDGALAGPSRTETVDEETHVQRQENIDQTAQTTDGQHNTNGIYTHNMCK